MGNHSQWELWGGTRRQGQRSRLPNPTPEATAGHAGHFWEQRWARAGREPALAPLHTAAIPELLEGLSTLTVDRCCSDRCTEGRFSGSSEDPLNQPLITLPSTPILHWNQKHKSTGEFLPLTQCGVNTAISRPKCPFGKRMCPIPSCAGHRGYIGVCGRTALSAFSTQMFLREQSEAEGKEGR
ncbi:hypothetical protein UY3_08145 [Chelonia mydas]|uniref:Uncharacterized protein n=1 Tax=Chelonia mydas TaxID=8469 RepID=M7BBL6_CHEMY|nr:hypothetical protein UY3_08145 [Chelonia mydas]